METNNILFHNLFPNTELGMDIKLLTRKPGRLPVGEALSGALTRDGETHMTFVEGAKAVRVPQKRYPKPYDGVLLSFTQREDGTYRCNFKDFVVAASFSEKQLRQLANRIKNEFVNGYPGFVEKEDGDQ